MRISEKCSAEGNKSPVLLQLSNISKYLRQDNKEAIKREMASTSLKNLNKII